VLRAPYPRTVGTTRARPAVAAVGLGRQPPDEPERLPSVRLKPCGPSGLGHARCSLASPRPAPCRPPRAQSSPVKGRQVASSYPARPREETLRSPTEPSEKDASHRLLQPTPVTSTLRIVRFPGVPRRGSLLCLLRLTALRRCGVSRPGTGSPWAFAPRRPGWGALPHAYRMSQPGGAALDGDAPASACAATST
jgi:hypothetical protein